MKRKIHLRHLLCATCVAVTMSVGFGSGAVKSQEIEFWSQPYGDLLAWRQGMDGLISKFEAESGISVNYEVLNWSQAFNQWLTIAQGGAAPDCADMFWLHSFSAIGGDNYGPMPINEYRDRWPNLEEEFYAGALQDVIWRGDFYGIPWRGDIRAVLYRTDYADEAGLAAPPDTWDELVDAAKAMTVRDDNGNVTRWGLALGTSPSQNYVQIYWQAGGLFMTEDGRTATIDNDATRTALSWIRDLVWKHEVLNPEFMEKSYDAEADFYSGNVAIMYSTPGAIAPNIAREYPQLNGKWALSVPTMGPANRDAYSGAGYVGVLRGSDNVEACVDWIQFLSRPENMQRLSESSGNVSPLREVMMSEYWSDEPWKRVTGETLNYGHTSQHPSPVWSAMVRPEPGSVIYDMVYEAVIEQQDLDEVVTRAQERMQSEMSRAFTD